MGAPPPEPAPPPPGRNYGYLDAELGFIDTVTGWWMERRGRATLLMAVVLGVLGLLSGWLLEWGAQMHRLSIVQSMAFFILAFGMVLHHKLAKGCWVHLKKVPVCHGFYGVGLMLIAALFLYFGWKALEPPAGP